MQVTPTKDFSVAVVGGGMCGLACAIGLIRAGINVKVFEAATKFDEIGAGVGLGPNALLALKGLGVLEAVIKAINIADATTQADFRFIAGAGDHEHVYDIRGAGSEDKSDLEQRGLAIYRPTFLAALLPLIDPSIVFFTKRLTSTTLLLSGQYRLSFADGTTHDTDIVIGADGIKSAVRRAVVDTPDTSNVAFVNKYVYRGMVSVAALDAADVKLELHTRPHVWVGMGRSIVTYPIRNHTFLNVGASVSTREPGAPFAPEKPSPWVQIVDQQELLDAYKDGWGSDALAILREMKEPSRWTLQCVYPPLESFVKDRIVLIGDAAHAMVPYLGAGVGQGFEDAYALCQFLAHPKVTKDSLSHALYAYDNLRRPRANRVLEESLKAGDIHQTFGQGGLDIDEARQRLKETFESEWHHELWSYDLVGKVSQALDAL